MLCNAHYSGVHEKARFYCVNILEELDVPTEVSKHLYVK